MKSTLKPLLLLLAIVLLGFLLRMAILSYGLPFLMYEDEPIYLNKALSFGFGDFDPRYFKKPPFFLYFYFGFYYLSYLFQLLTHSVDSWARFAANFWLDPTTITLLGRSITLTFSVASITLLYALGARVFSPAIGLGAAFLLAIHTNHVSFSPRVVADIPALFFILLTAWFALSVYDKGRWRDYLCCAAAVALTMSFKYNVFALTFLWAAHFLREVTVTHPEKAWWYGFQNKKLWLTTALSGLVFVCLSPYVVLNASHFLAHLDFERQHVLQRSIGIHSHQWPFVSLLPLLFKILPRGLTWPLYVFAMAGVMMGWLLPLLLKRWSRWFTTLFGPSFQWQRCWLLLSFPTVFFLVLCQFRLVTGKYLLPTTPFLALMATVMVFLLVNRVVITFASGLNKRFPSLNAFGAIILLLLLAWPLGARTLDYVEEKRNPHTLSLAYTELKARVKPGESILLEKNTFPSWNKPIVDRRFPKNTVMQMGVPETTTQTVEHFSPDYLLINPKSLKDPQGRLLLPYPETYYTYLQDNFYVVAAIGPAGLVVMNPNQMPVWVAHQDYLMGYQQLSHSVDKAHRYLKHPGPVLVLLKKRSLQLDLLPEDLLGF